MPNNEYDVYVNRSVRQTAVIRVEASNQDEAEKLALISAVDETFEGGWEHGETLETVVETVDLISDPSAIASPEGLQAFWRNSEAVAGFIADHCIGERPASIVRRDDGSLLMTDGERSLFSLISANGGSYMVSSASDPISFFDPEAELSEVGRYDDPAEAFSAAAEAIGVEISAAPKP